ncbi:hypothetical protein NDU88_004599 [Pleurodeles waltl]|uniref:Uncharacterized protein n=1 Tax=Pleurodeles waltl TaxID=8319 RepID=A0AAV7QIT2_PLEWA|nr:hypothetical protein NDU88_004599 [Pleurodeles waltl]
MIISRNLHSGPQGVSAQTPWGRQPPSTGLPGLVTTAARSLSLIDCSPPRRTPGHPARVRKVCSGGARPGPSPHCAPPPVARSTAGSPVALAQGLLPSWYGSVDGAGAAHCSCQAQTRPHVPLPLRPDPCPRSSVPVRGPLTSHWRCRDRAPSHLCLSTAVPPPPIDPPPGSAQAKDQALAAQHGPRFPGLLTSPAGISSSAGPAPELYCSLLRPPL